MSKYTSKLIYALQSIDRGANQSYSERAGRGDYILNLVFEIGTAGHTFTQAEKEHISAPLSKELAAIKSSVTYAVSKFKTGLEPWWLKQRSALQFLVEDYASFPIGGDATLADKFREADLDASVASLNGIIYKWKDVIDPDEGHTSEEFRHAGVPQSHAWWFL